MGNKKCSGFKNSLSKSTGKTTVKYSIKTICEEEDLYLYLRMLKAGFCEKTEEFCFERILKTLKKNSNNLFEILYKIMNISFRNSVK